MTCVVPIVGPTVGPTGCPKTDAPGAVRPTAAGNATCGKCHYRFTPEGNRHYYPAEVKRQAVDMYAEGMGITAAIRVLGVKMGTVYSWVKLFLGHKSPPDWGSEGTGNAATSQLTAAPGDFLRCDVKLQMWSYVGARRNGEAAGGLGVDGGG